MSNVDWTGDEKTQVTQAVALLKMRAANPNNKYTRWSVEKRLKNAPPPILALAQKTLDKTKPTKSESAKTPRATLKSASLTAKAFTLPNGHEMRFDLKIEMPKKYEVTAAEIPRDLLGVYFEWWEEIVVEYDFKEPPVSDPANEKAVKDRAKRIAERKATGEGSSTKPWSDIYLSQPNATTFERWVAAIQDAVDGKLKGEVLTGPIDRPLVSESPNRFTKRILRFRINAGDDRGDQWKGDAIQVVVIEEGKLVSSVYQDSADGNLIFGTGVAEPMRYRPGVGEEVRGEDAINFVGAVESDKAGCRKFDNREMDQLLARKGKNDILTELHKYINEGNRLNAMPLIPDSDEYWEYDASDGGLLVAQLTGGKVKRLYHTSGATKEVEIMIGDSRQKITVRPFEQLPLD